MDLSSLVIRLSADTATLQADLGRGSAAAEQYSDKVTRSVQQAGAAIGASVAAAAAGMTALLGKAIENADNLNKMSQKIGVAVESLSALGVQAKLSDVELDSLQGGLAKLAKNAADAAAGGKENAATFKAMGVSLKDANGNLRSTEDLLGDVAKRFASYEDGAAKTALAQRALGKSGADLIPF